MGAEIVKLRKMVHLFKTPTSMVKNLQKKLVLGHIWSQLVGSQNFMPFTTCPQMEQMAGNITSGQLDRMLGHKLGLLILLKYQSSTMPVGNKDIAGKITKNPISLLRWQDKENLPCTDYFYVAFTKMSNSIWL